MAREWGIDVNAPYYLSAMQVRERSQDYAEKVRLRARKHAEVKCEQSPEPKRSCSPPVKSSAVNAKPSAVTSLPSPYLMSPRGPQTARDIGEGRDKGFPGLSEDWCSRHHVTWSLGNTSMPRNRRIYFDNLPQVRVVAGQYADNPIYWPDSGADSNRHRLQRAWQKQFHPFHFQDKAMLATVSGYPEGSDHVALPQLGPDNPDSTQSLYSTQEQSSACGSLEHSPARRGSQENSPARRRTSIVSPRKLKKAKSFVMKKSAMCEIPSAVALSHFLDWCQEKFGNMARVWRLLDKDGNMKLSKYEFTKGLNQMMYPGGDLQTLWNILDRDQTGWVSFLHFAVEEALVLAHFKRWADSSFGSCKALFRILDTSRDGRLSYREFGEGLEKLGFHNHNSICARTLFDLIDDAGDESSMRKITAEELMFLDMWEIPEHLFAEPDADAAKQFVKLIVARFRNNPLLAWRKALDTDSSMRVSYYEFIKAFKTLSQKGILPATKSNVPSLFRALDRCNTGWLSLRDFDEATYDLLIRFSSWAKNEYGKVSLCCKPLAGSEGGDRARFRPFAKAVRHGMALSQDEAWRLFEGLSLESKRDEATIKPDELFFLDKWDPTHEQEEKEAWERMMISGEAQIMIPQGESLP